MARIELKNLDIRLVDGHSNTAAVNDQSIVAGDTTLGIDTLGTPGFIPVSSRFTIDNVDQEFLVTGQNANAQITVTVGTAASGTFDLEVTVDGGTPDEAAAIPYNASNDAIKTALEGLDNVGTGDVTVTGTTLKTITFGGSLAGLPVAVTADFGSLSGGTGEALVTLHAGGVTHDITFTPALASGDLPIDDAAITFTGRTCEVTIGDGNITYTQNREFNYELDRGELDTVTDGDEQPMEVTVDFVWEFLRAIEGSGNPTPDDVFNRRGEAAEWETSATSDPCAAFSLDVEVDNIPRCGDIPGERITFPEFRWESLPHNASDAQISVTGRCNATEPIIERI